MPPHSTPPLLQPKQRSTSPAEPSRGPAELGAPDLALNRRNAPQNKRKSVVAVACRPCQRRKHKCDGQRPACTQCLTRKQIDCTYDADGDLRRTTALKSRIQSLSRQVDDLKDIVRGIAGAVDPDQARATARQLANQNFLNIAEIAEAFRNAVVHTSATSDIRGAALGFEMIDPQMLSDFGASNAAVLHSQSTIETSGGNVNSGTTGEPSLSSWASFSQADALAPIPAVHDEDTLLDDEDNAFMAAVCKFTNDQRAAASYTLQIACSLTILSYGLDVLRSDPPTDIDSCPALPGHRLSRQVKLQPVFDISRVALYGNDQSLGDMSPGDPIPLHSDSEDVAIFHTIRKCGDDIYFNILGISGFIWYAKPQSSRGFSIYFHAFRFTGIAKRPVHVFTRLRKGRKVFMGEDSWPAGQSTSYRLTELGLIPKMVCGTVF